MRKRGWQQHLTATRGIGAVTIIIAILSIIAGAESKLLLAAGILLLSVPSAYGKRTLDLAIHAASRGKDLIITALADAAYWAAFLISGYGILFALNKVSQNVIAGTSITQQAMLSPELAAQNLAGAQTLLWSIGGGLLAFWLICVTANGISRGYIWSVIFRKTYNKKFARSFLKLTLAWWALWLIPFGILAAALSKNPEVLTFSIIALGIVAMYFSLWVHVIFIGKQKIGKSITLGIANGLSKFYLLLVPASLALLISVIAENVFRLIPGQFGSAINILFVILFLSWLRLYLGPIVQNISD